MTKQNMDRLQELEEENRDLKEALRKREDFIRNTFGTYLTNEVLEELLSEKKGLHIGGYRKQPELGAPYNGTSIGRMSKDIWQQHFKVVGGFQDIDPDAIQPVEFTTEFAKDYNNNCGKLVVLKNVHFTNADGKSTLTTGTATGGNYVNQTLKEFGSNVVVRTSTYADFGALVMPTGAVTLTGIATRYNNTWQILIRKTSDIKY